MHQPVPPGKIQTIIALKILVVHIVVHRSIEPLEEPVPVESLWKNFKAQVAIHIIQGHEDQERKKVYEMDREAKSKNINDRRFYKRLRRLK
jgi:hypothetical protein